jgi:hypothetical protein
MIAPTQPNVDLQQLRQTLGVATNKDAFSQAVVNAPFEQKLETAYLFLGFISFYLVDPGSKLVRLSAVSDTEAYRLAVNGYKFEPDKFSLSLTADKNNDIVKAVRSNKPVDNIDWTGLSRREADPEQARLNQANSGIAYSAIYPLAVPGGGALLFCYYQYQENIGEAQHSFMADYARMVSELLTQLHFKR